MAMRAAVAAPRGLGRLCSTIPTSTSTFIPPPATGGASAREKAEPSTNLFVSGLSKRTTTEKLQEAFSQFGEVAHARVVTDRVSGYSKGFGFVRYATIEEAAKGIEGMDGKTRLFPQIEASTRFESRNGLASLLVGSSLGWFQQATALAPPLPTRFMSTQTDSVESSAPDSSTPVSDVPPRIKFKRLDKTAKHIMQILDKEAVEKVRAQREIPDIKPGYIVQLKVEVPENKRRVSIIKGIVIARRNAGLNSTFRIRRLVAGVGIESLFPLYSPNIKEIKVLDKKRVRRAKLYYLREKMNALKSK